MIVIDGNVVVRYLTGDHPEQSARARVIVDGRYSWESWFPASSIPLVSAAPVLALKSVMHQG